MDYAELKAKMADFFSAGPVELNPPNVVKEADELLQGYHMLKEKDNELIQRCQEMQKKAEAIKIQLQEDDIMGKFEVYVTKMTQEQLLVAAHHLSELKSNKLPSLVPSIVKNIINSAPKALPRNSKLYRLIVSTVDELKCEMLDDFHRRFEAHLVRSEELSQQEEDSWGPFLASAREWILAYIMICLLPSAVQGSDQILEVYKNSLDSAFTPLWGRFHFHLATARESGSVDQILWAFDYSKTFVTLLTGLCVQITRSSATEGKKGGDVSCIDVFPASTEFPLAALTQITEKASRFLRAHVAECIDIYMNSSRIGEEYFMPLVEKALELDSHMFTLLTDSTSNASSAVSSVYTLSVCSVFCDHPQAREMWIDFDAQHFQNEMLHAVSQIGSGSDIYGFYFDSPHHFSGRLRCFRCVYDCLHLFRLACMRYFFLPVEAQDVFTARVLEPLLLTALSLVWYRVRSERTIREVNAGARPFYIPLGAPVEACAAVIDSVHYMSQTLHGLASALPPFRLPTELLPARIERSWKILKRWIFDKTRRYGSDGELMITAVDVLRKIEVIRVQIAETMADSCADINAFSKTDKTDLSCITNIVREYIQEIADEVEQKMKSSIRLVE